MTGARNSQILQQHRATYQRYMLGPAVVEPQDGWYGHDKGQWQLEEYGDYIATSDAVYSVLSFRADMLATRSKHFRGFLDGEDVTESSTLVKLLRYVNDFWTLSRLLIMTEYAWGLWGEAFWFLNRGVSRRLPPQEIWWAKPTQVFVFPDPKTYVGYYEFETANGERIRYERDEVLWMPLPNPNDEFAGLSNLAAARLAADVRSAAWKSNRNLFSNGMQMGGVVFPNQDEIWTVEQAQALERKLAARFQGVDKAHKWAVFRNKVELAQAGVTPHDAQFVESLTMTYEDVIRAFRMPLDLFGGQRTYNNLESAERFAWVFGIMPRSDFLTDELTEKLAPLFTDTDEVKISYDDVAALQQAKSEEWERSRGQLQEGVITINEWRAENGLEVVPWGDVPLNLIAGGQESDGAEEQEDALELLDGDETTEPGSGEREFVEHAGCEHTREVQEAGFVPWGSELHRRVWQRAMDGQAKWLAEWADKTAALFKSQQQSVLARLRERGAQSGHARYQRTPDAAAIEPFPLDEWVRKFRVEMRPVLEQLIEDAGELALVLLEELNGDALPATVELDFDLFEPEVQRFIERSVQRFAREVNETTWKRLQESLVEGLKAGEDMQELADRVTVVMGDRIASSAQTIAQTEVGRAQNGGTLEAWAQTRLRLRKHWVATFVNTRPTHQAAHARYASQGIPLDMDFEVGAGSGPAPGQIGIAKEDINCQCIMVAEVVTDD